MKANELRSGSIISINRKFVVVDHIRSHDFSTTINDGFTIIFNNGNLETDDNDSIEPIPLTPSVLEAAGFEVYHKNLGTKWHKNNYFTDCKEAAEIMCLSLNPENGRCGISDTDSESSPAMTGRRILYLHQLQNLYFALTGTELEIDIEKLNT